MTCDICQKKKATVHLTEIVDEQMSEMHLCEECARNKSAQMEQQFGLADLLAGLSDFGKPAASKTTDPAVILTCSHCGLTYDDFRKFGRLGCSQCYASFKDNLGGLLRKIHGSSRHLGKAPLSMPEAKLASAATVIPALEQAIMDPPKPKENSDDLKRQLQQAILSEDFEKAALLRDKIKDFEQ